MATTSRAGAVHAASAVGILMATMTAACMSQTREPDVVGRDVIDALEHDPSVSVVVMLSLPAALRSADADPALVRQEIARLQNDVLATLAPTEFRLSVRYVAIPGFSGRLYAAGVPKLRTDPRIARVSLDIGGGGSASHQPGGTRNGQ